MSEKYQIIPVSERTDLGHVIDAWQIAGTAITYAGQEGERLAREHAASLDEERAAQRRRSREGD